MVHLSVSSHASKLSVSQPRSATAGSEGHVSAPAVAAIMATARARAAPVLTLISTVILALMLYRGLAAN